MGSMLSYILMSIGYEYWKLGIWEVLDLCMVPTPYVETIARANISRTPAANKDCLASNIRLSLIRCISYITLPMRGD